MFSWPCRSARKIVDDDSIDVARFYANDPFGNRIEIVAVSDRGFSDRARRS